MNDGVNNPVLHPDLAAYLDAVDAGRRDGRTQALHTMVPEQARRAFESASPAVREDAAVTTCALSIPTRDGASIDARLYLPDACAAMTKKPLLLYFHGGGYTVGSLDSHAALCRALAARTPCALLAVAYRLAPEYLFPTAIDDAVDATFWLREHTGALGLDPQRIAVGGDSAGGTIATVLSMLAVRERHAVGVDPCLQLLFYPVTDATCDSASMELFEQGYLLEGETLRWFHRNYARTEADYADWRFSPLQAGSWRGVAPAFFALAGFDPLYDEGLAYARALERDGVAVQLRVYADMTHDFLRMAAIVPEVVERAFEDIARALRERFRP